jgi:short-subunit dehydrogenase
MPLGPLVEETDATTDRVLKVNLHAVIHGTREAARRMLPRGRGHIVNLASTLGKAGLPGGATYCATKFAVVGFCEAMDAELAGSGVRISVVLPGVVDTSLGEGVRSPRIIRRVQPHDVALAIADVLASPRYEVYVPFEAGPLSLAAAALPHRMRDRLSRAMGLHATLAHADAGARAAYEARLRETVADHEAPAKLVG